MATLIDVGTPGPALAGVAGSNSGLTGPLAQNTTQTTSNTVYNLNSVAITAGTWVVTGICGVLAGTETLYLSTTSAGGTNSWPVQAPTDSYNVYITAVIKVTGSTTIYLNGKNSNPSIVAHSLMLATQIV